MGCNRWGAGGGVGKVVSTFSGSQRRGEELKWGCAVSIFPCLNLVIITNQQQLQTYCNSIAAELTSISILMKCWVCFGGSWNVLFLLLLLWLNTLVSRLNPCI